MRTSLSWAKSPMPITKNVQILADKTGMSYTKHEAILPPSPVGSVSADTSDPHKDCNKIKKAKKVFTLKIHANKLQTVEKLPER